MLETASTISVCFFLCTCIICVCKRMTVFSSGSHKKSIGSNIELTAALVQMSLLCANTHSCIIPGSVFIFALKLKMHC